MKPDLLNLLDVLVFTATFLALFYCGAGWWAALIVPYGLWNFLFGLLRK